MKKFLLSLFLFFAPFLWEDWGGLFSQSTTWYITPGNPNPDMSWGVDVDSLGNIWWATNEVVLPDSLYDIYISKIDSTGQTLWKKKIFSTTYNDIAFIVKIKSPYLFMGGRIETDISTDSANLLLLTCLMQGDTVALQWDYQWDGGFGYEELDGIEADTSGIYIAGWTSPDTVPAHKDMVVQKLDFFGNVIWDTIWSGTSLGFEGANGHLIIDDSAIYITAHYDTLPGRALLIAFDKDNGNPLWDSLWDKTPLFPYLYYDDFYGLAMSSDSFLYAVGPCNAWLVFGQQALVKFDRSGTKIWEQAWGGALYEFGRAVIVDGDSIIYSAANTYSYGNGKVDIVLLKYDSLGNFLDSVIWGTQKYDLVHDIAMFGNYLYLVGTTDTAGQVAGVGSPEEDAILLKVRKNPFLFPDTIPGVFTSLEYFINNEDTDIQIFPNPSNGNFQIAINDLRVQNVELKIHDLLGREVFKSKINRPDTEFNMEHLLQGIYFLQLSSEKIFITKKLEIIR